MGESGNGAPFRFLNPHRHEQLTQVPLYVLGGVEEQPSNRGWKRLAANRPGMRECGFVRLPEQVDRALHLNLEGSKQCVDGDGVGRRCHLVSKDLPLMLVELDPLRVGKQPVDDPAHVPQVESRRRDTPGAGPEQVLGKLGSKGADLLARLEEGMRDRLQLLRNLIDRAAEPEFGQFVGHRCADPVGARVKAAWTEQRRGRPLPFRRPWLKLASRRGPRTDLTSAGENRE